MSDTMEEGVIAAWHKKEGDEIKSGDIVAEVETDKATMDLEAYEGGTILYIGAKEGEAVPIDGVMYIIGEKGEDYQSLLKEAETQETTSTATQEEQQATNKKTDSDATSQPSQDPSDIPASIELMPKMSDTMEEGVVVAWHKKVGDKVQAGDLLAEIETDKAVMELEAYEAGTILYIGVEEGDSIAVDAVLYIVGEPDADYKALLAAHQTSGNGQSSDDKATIQKEKTPSEATTKTTESKSNGVASTTEEGRIKISPLARRMAEELGYDISQIDGTGEEGRIVKRDIENFQPEKKSTSSSPTEQPSQKTQPSTSYLGEDFEEVKVSQMRKTIARRLAESKFTAPHFYLTIEINMDKTIEARKQMNTYAPTKISFNDIVIRATAAALKQHPQVNSSWQGDTIRTNHQVHIGVAVAVDEGLLVPVVRFADTKSLSQIASEVKDLGEKARNKQLQPSDWEGNTFTISNLGMFGIEEFTAIINPPDACILAVGGIKETVLVKDGEMVVGNVMKVTLSCDHRVVDGATGAAFLKTLKGNLEDPIRILV